MYKRQDDSIPEKFDIIAILFAYCSIRSELHPLIINSLDSLINHLRDSYDSTNGIVNSDIFGMYTIVSYVEQFDEISPQLLQFLQLNLRDTLIHQWIPLWQNYKDSIPLQLSNFEQNSNEITSLLMNNSKLDFFIATSIDNLFNKQEQNGEKSSYIIYQITKRVILLNHWIPKDIYQIATDIIISHEVTSASTSTSLPTVSSSQSSSKPIKHDLLFNLQIIMELIDHPELNYLEEPRLILLLQVSRLMWVKWRQVLVLIQWHL